MNATVAELARLVGGKLEGDGSRLIDAARPLQDAGPGCITFVQDEKHVAQLADSHAAAVLHRDPLPHTNGFATIQVADPFAAFLTVFQHLHAQPPAPPRGLDSRAGVDPTARLGRDVSLYPFAFIDAGTVIGDRCRIHSGVSIGRNCKLGDDVVLYPNVVIYDGCTLGHRVTVHASSVIGADGFGYRQQGGRHVKVPQLGGVEIGDDVEIGSCSTIDRGTFEATRVGAGTKIDNLVQVAHNCRIGRHNLLIGQVGIAGSTTTGDYVVIAGQAGLRDHIHIGDRAVIGARAGVINDIPADSRVLGEPARPEREVKQMVLMMERLPDMRKDLKRVMQALKME